MLGGVSPLLTDLQDFTVQTRASLTHPPSALRRSPKRPGENVRVVSIRNAHLSIFTSIRVFTAPRGSAHKPIGGHIWTVFYTAANVHSLHTFPLQAPQICWCGRRRCKRSLEPVWSRSRFQGNGSRSNLPGPAGHRLLLERRPAGQRGSAERAAEEMKNEILLLCSLFFLLLLSSISCYYYYTIYLSRSLSPHPSSPASWCRCSPSRSFAFYFLASLHRTPHCYLRSLETRLLARSAQRS